MCQPGCGFSCKRQGVVRLRDLAKFLYSCWPARQTFCSAIRVSKCVCSLVHCDGYSWLSTRLHLELTKTQSARYTSEDFLKPFEVGRPTLHLGLLSYKMRLQSGSFCKGGGRRKFTFFVCLLSLSFSLALGHTCSGFQWVMKTSWDISLKTYWILFLELPLVGSHCWASWLATYKLLW